MDTVTCSYIFTKWRKFDKAHKYNSCHFYTCIICTPQPFLGTIFLPVAKTSCTLTLGNLAMLETFLFTIIVISNILLFRHSIWDWLIWLFSWIALLILFSVFLLLFLKPFITSLLLKQSSSIFFLFSSVPSLPFFNFLCLFSSKSTEIITS